MRHLADERKPQHRHTLRHTPDTRPATHQQYGLLHGSPHAHHTPATLPLHIRHTLVASHTPATRPPHACPPDTRYTLVTHMQHTCHTPARKTSATRLPHTYHTSAIRLPHACPPDTCHMPATHIPHTCHTPATHMPATRLPHNAPFPFNVARYINTIPIPILFPHPSPSRPPNCTLPPSSVLLPPPSLPYLLNHCSSATALLGTMIKMMVGIRSGVCIRVADGFVSHFPAV